MADKDTKLKITQVRSAVGRNVKQKRTLKALGIRRMNHSVVHVGSPQIMGMIKKVEHLVTVEASDA
jgi:large subunit ribosomal protein L30